MGPCLGKDKSEGPEALLRGFVFVSSEVQRSGSVSSITASCTQCTQRTCQMMIFVCNVQCNHHTSPQAYSGERSRYPHEGRKYFKGTEPWSMYEALESCSVAPAFRFVSVIKVRLVVVAWKILTGSLTSRSLSHFHGQAF